MLFVKKFQLFNYFNMVKRIMFALTVFIAIGCQKKTQIATENESVDSLVVQQAKQAFIYSLPLALMDITSKKLTNVESNASGNGAPFNQFTIATKFPDAKFRDVVRPNADTFYNTAFLELTAEPMVLHLPATNKRYYLMPMLNAWSDVFNAPGSRTTGNSEGDFLITGPFWKGVVPKGMIHIPSPTNLVWILGRIQVNGPSDVQEVVKLEKQVTLTPLSKFYSIYPLPKGIIDTSIDKRSPNEIVAAMDLEKYFNYVNKLMVANPPLKQDSLFIKQMVKIGVGPGADFNMNNYNKNTKAALSSIPTEVIKQLSEQLNLSPKKLINGWNMNLNPKMGNYGTDYLFRAIVAFQGLGANLIEDAVYPSCVVDSEGNPLNGENNYIMHFNKNETPPVQAFWSLSMYNNEGYFVENVLNRHAIGDRNNLKVNADGSIDIYIQKNSPGKDKESNWLPTPAGDFNLLMRAYWPKEPLLNGSWTPPAVKNSKSKN
jgi:DNA sulfur modification protein DndE